jgi:hypothetical protein
VIPNRAGAVPFLEAVAVATVLGIGWPLSGSAQVHAGDEARALAFAPQRDTLLASFLDPGQEVLLELRIGRIAARTVEALERNGTALLPAADLFEMGEVRFNQENDGTLRAIRYPADRMVVISPADGIATLNGDTVPAPPEAIAWTGERLFVAVPLLERLFDLTIRVDWSSLTAVVIDPEALPLGRRVAREARWRALGAEGPRDPADLYLGLDRRSLGGMVVDWSLSTIMDDPGGSTSYRLGGAGRVLGGALRVTSQSLGPVNDGSHRVDATWETVRRQGTWLTQVRVGDGLSTGPRPRAVRGIALTNAPFLRGGFFGVDTFTGQVGPGWDVELRQSGRTLDVSRADEQGAFALDIPVRYGDNPVQVVAFGPHGEVVTADRLLLLDRDRLPGGRFEWGLSAGDCRSALCDLAGNLDLRYGISNRWTIRGGMEGFARDTVPGLLHPYLGVSGALTPSVQVAAEGVGNGFARLGGTWSPSQDLRLRAAQTFFQRGVDAPILHDARRRATTELDLFARPLTSHDRWFVQGSAIHQSLTTGSSARLQAMSGLQFGSYRVDAGLRRVTSNGFGGARTTETFQIAGVTGIVTPAPGHRIWLRGQVETVGARAFQRVEGRAGYQVTRDTRVDLALRWSRFTGYDLSLSLNAFLPQLRSLTQLFAPEGGDTRVTQVTQGTIQWNEAVGGLAFGQTPGLERGGVSGYVFIDENGNGIRDPGEPVLEGARVIVGGQTVRTDEQGRYTAWDLVPFEPIRIQVDPGSVPDPTWAPYPGVVEVEVPPASYRRVDLPLAHTGEVLGRAVRVNGEGREFPVGNLELELVDLDRNTVKRIATFSDGGIYVYGVPRGRFELRVAPNALRNTGLQAEAPSIPFVMPPEAGRMVVSGLIIRLVPE